MDVEIEPSSEEFSKEELQRELYSSLRSAGVLNSIKGQLRARMLEHLTHHSGEAMERNKRHGKLPTLTERLLSSLFLDYLECSGFTFTISVFMPESQMDPWPPFSYEEMLELLHLDPSSGLHTRLTLNGGEGRECLAHQLVMVLQQMAQRNCIQEVSTQTSPAEVCKQQAARISCTSHKEHETSITEVEGSYFRHKQSPEAQRLLPYRSLEDKITVLHQEFNARVNAEVAVQVSRLREYEINTARMDEAARYRRRLARAREELEEVHKACMDRIKVCEESLLERIQCKEQAIEASAYEQRQKILKEITCLRERENKLWQFKESQERREENLDARELSLRAKEDEVVRVRKTLYALADDILAMRKELEEQHRELCDGLRRDRTLLEAGPEQMTKQKAATSFELATTRSDKGLIQALRWRPCLEGDQRSNLVQTIRELEEKLKQHSLPASAPVSISHQRLEERLLDLQAELEQERLQRQASEKALERTLQQKKVELAEARSRLEEWVAEHKNVMATIHQQDAELQKKQEERDRAMCNLEILQVQHTTDERELLETTTLLRKSQQALKAERLEHCAVRPHVNAVVPSTSVAPQRDRLSIDQHGHHNNLFDHEPSANEAFGKKSGASRTKPEGKSHDRRTQIISDNAAKGASLDQDLEQNPVGCFPASMSPPYSSGINYELLELRDDGGITSLTKTEAFLEAVVDDSFEEFKDAIPSWRKTPVPECARPVSWNDGYDELVTDMQSVVTSLQYDWSTVDNVAVCSSSRDPGTAWNLEAPHMESSSTAKGATTTERVQRETHTMGNKCERGLASSYIPDAFNFKKDSRNSRDQEKYKTNSRTNLELTNVGKQGADKMDSHSKGDHHKTADSITEVHKNPTMMPEIDNQQPLNSARSVHSRSCEHVKCKEKIEDNQQYSRSEIESRTVEEGKTTQGDETRELDATDEPHHYSLKLTNRAEEVAMADNDIVQDPDKELNQHTRSLRSPRKCFYKKIAEPLSESAFSQSPVNSQKEESRRWVRIKNRFRTREKLSGLPEIREMLFKQERYLAREMAQMNLQDSVAPDAQVSPERSAEAKRNRIVNLNFSEADKLPDYDMNALKSLRTSIVIRKQGVLTDKEVSKETGKVSKTHPILALAIRNDQLVKLEKQDKIPIEGKNDESFLRQVHVETIMKNKLTGDEIRFSTATPRLVTESLNVQQASEPTLTPASHQENHSSSEEPIYEDDSFEEDEEERVDQKPMKERKHRRSDSK